jgi:UDP-glucose 4-epimerase
MKNILVTGGAGYIGSHAVKALLNSGYNVAVFDNLSKGHAKAVDMRAVLVKGDLCDVVLLDKVFGEGKFDAVIHFAGYIEVGLSMKEPAMFFQNNLINGINLLEAMRKYGVKNIIFSSTAAVYGFPKVVPVKEDGMTDPINFYGQSKLMFEQILKNYDDFYGFKFVALRYFNASGADLSGEIGQDYIPETHLIARVIKTVLGKYESLGVFGNDYETRDGTCVRDYIHVVDLVDAHIKALEYLFDGKESNIFNLGNGLGFTVKEVIEMVEKVSGKKVPVKMLERREGDPPALVADSTKAKVILGWIPKYSGLEDIISTAWKWHSSHPNGFIC